MLHKVKIKQQVEAKIGILSSIRDQRTKKLGSSEQLKSCETREVPYTFRYTNGHLFCQTICLLNMHSNVASGLLHQYCGLDTMYDVIVVMYTMSIRALPDVYAQGLMACLSSKAQIP